MELRPPLTEMLFPAYQSAARYLIDRPCYRFNGRDSDELISNCLRSAASTQTDTLIDCGAGPGPTWENISDLYSKIIAVEPNRQMWRTHGMPLKATYVQESGLGYLLSRYEPQAVVAWIWSFSYAMTSFFEKYDHEGRMIVHSDPSLGDWKARVTLRACLEQWASSIHMFALFDERSEEQEFITGIWGEIAPFPSTGRGYARRILKEVLQEFSVGRGEVLEQHFTGHVDYGPLDIATERLISFQFFQEMRTMPTVFLPLVRFLADHEENGHAVLRSGCFIYWYVPQEARSQLTAIAGVTK